MKYKGKDDYGFIFLSNRFSQNSDHINEMDQSINNIRYSKTTSNKNNQFENEKFSIK